MFRTIKSWLTADTASRAQPKPQLGLTALEAREVPAMLSATVVGNELVVRMESNGGNVEVIQSGSGFMVNDLDRRAAWQLGAADRVRFEGAGGNDRFVNKTFKPTVGYGYGGNDVLVGGGGNDYLDGGIGNDRLNGRGGTDQLLGSSGDDVLIAIDGGTSDYIDPWSGRDVIWVDKVGTGCDRLSGYGSGYIVQQVGSFSNTADKTLDGDRIIDPWAAWTDSTGTVTTQYATRRFEGNPLFSSAGPQALDVRQGNLGDCWMVATAAAVANDSPQVHQQRMADFDDGTYGVKLGDKFYRVDNDLPVSSVSSTTPVYAKLGAQNSMWVAVLEKAYAHYRRGDNSYLSLNGGGGAEASRAFGSTVAGDKWSGTYSSATALGNDIAARWNNYEAVTICTGDARYGKYMPCGLINSHCYTVMAVNYTSTGAVSSILLRNPWGIDTDSASGARDGANDGFLTLTPTQLYSLGLWVQWGKV